MLSIVLFYSKCARALTFQNVLYAEGQAIRIELVPKKGEKNVSIEDLEGMDEPMTWMKQFANALSVNGGEDLEESTIMDGIMHYASVGWKVECVLLR